MIVNEILIATNEPNSYGPAFTTIRIIFELLTAFILIAFRSESRKNMFATIMAAGIAGTSMFMAFQAITTFEQISRNAEFAFPLFTILICLLFMFNGGNAAQVFHPFHPAFRVAWGWLWPWGKK